MSTQICRYSNVLFIFCGYWTKTHCIMRQTICTKFEQSINIDSKFKMKGCLRWVINDYLSMVFKFGFKSGICLLIAPFPVHCFSITFDIRCS